jgi:tryptophan synthase beta subunit
LQRALPTLPDGTAVIVNVSGRGDKDVETVRERFSTRTAGTSEAVSR